MAHFAKLNNENIVIEVIVVSNQTMLDENGQEQESLGIAFLKQHFGEEFNFVQCSYNASFRWHFPGIGAVYLLEHDAFMPPKLYPSFVLDIGRKKWVPPIPYPGNPDTLKPINNNNIVLQWEPPIPCVSEPDDKKYRWDEATISWVLV